MTNRNLPQAFFFAFSLLPSLLGWQAFSFFTPKPAADWIFKHEKSGVKVYYKDEGSGVYDLKLVTTVEASMHSIAALLVDVESYPNWVYKTSEAWRVRTDSDTDMHYYINSDFPWPLDDRDVVVHSRISRDEKTGILTSSSKAVEGLIETRKNRIRMTTTDINWTFTPKEGGKTLIEYTLRSNPGGLLPDWLVNMAIDFGPVETMKKFKTEVATEKYRLARVGFLKD